MSDLDILRPEVRDPLDWIEAEYPEASTIRAELLRLAGENKRMRGIIETLDVEGHHRAEKAEAELAALKARAQWQPIETAPKDGTPILACLDGECYTGHGFLPVCVRWGTFHPNAKGKATWRASHGYKVEHITHWMPLPAPPNDMVSGGGTPPA